MGQELDVSRITALAEQLDSHLSPLLEVLYFYVKSTAGTTE